MNHNRQRQFEIRRCMWLVSLFCVTCIFVGQDLHAQIGTGVVDGGNFGGNTGDFGGNIDNGGVGTGGTGTGDAFRG